MHADSSNFAAGVGKKEAYEQVIEQAGALFDGQTNWVSSHERENLRESELLPFRCSIDLLSLMDSFTNDTIFRSGKSPN